MQVYLPIAEMSVNALLVLSLGGGVGFLSGMFGVGGGFLATPLLIFMGVPPAVAVGTQANQLVGASVSGVIAHWRRGAVDVKLGLVMLIGGFSGSIFGVWLFSLLQAAGQIDVAVSLMYVSVLGLVGSLMLWESVGKMIRTAAEARAKAAALAAGPLAEPIGGDSLLQPSPTRRAVRGLRRKWLDALPFKAHFPKSRLHVSPLAPILVGFVGGLIVAVMGVGGGFILVPAMIYLLGVPSASAPGTSLFQIIFTTAVTAAMQAVMNHTVDAVLALLLLIGGVIGAQYGGRVGGRLRGEQSRALLALLVLTVALRLAVELLATPSALFSLELEPRL